jgi:putative transposase
MPNYKRVFIENHYYFITAVIKNRKLQLLTDNTTYFKKALKASKLSYEYEIYALVVMSNHFHIIINPKNKNDYPQIISSIKREFTKQLDTNLLTKLAKYLTPSQIKHRESGVWQRRYFEHTVRNQQDLNHLTDYIHYNPVKYGFVKRAKDWQYSSFMKFVKNHHYDKNWCDFTENTDYD